MLDGLTQHLLEPELFKLFADEFTAELNRLRAAEGAAHEALEREAAQIERKLAKLVEAIMDGGSSKVLTAEIQKLETRQDELAALLQEVAGPMLPLIHPALAEVYRTKVSNLTESLADPALMDEAAEIIRSLVEAIILVPVDGKLEVELRSALAGILSLCAGGKRDKAPRAMAPEALCAQVKLVAGAGSRLCRTRAPLPRTARVR